MSRWTVPGQTGNYHPPCSARYGRMGEAEPIVCEGPPDHRGPHYSRAHGVRWHYPGKWLPRCLWRACTAPEEVIADEDSTRHLCPGGAALRRYPEVPRE